MNRNHSSVCLVAVGCLMAAVAGVGCAASSSSADAALTDSDSDIGGADASDVVMSDASDNGIWDVSETGPGDSADANVELTGRAVRFDGPRSVPPGVIFPVVVTVADSSFTGGLEIVFGEVRATIQVARGRGSVALVAPSSAEVRKIEVISEDFEGSVDVTVESRPERRLSGVISGADLQWSAGSDIVIDGNVTIESGRTLTIAAGTRVRMGDNTRLAVAGMLRSNGTRTNPVWFLADAAGWGEIDVTGSAEFEFSWMTAGGADSSRAFGHSKSQPVVRVQNGAAVTFSGGGIVDSPGKAFGSEKGSVIIEDALISRCDTGGEHKSSEVQVRRTHFMQIPDADGSVDDDDNDCIYLNDTNGDGPACQIEDCVFFMGEDDAIDHNGAELSITGTWIQSMNHEGVAASVGRRVTIVDSVFSECEQGIEAGYGAPEVMVRNSLIFGNDVGLRWGDSYDSPGMQSSGTITVVDSVAVNNVRNVRFEDDQQGEAPDGSASVSCSRVATPEWDGRNGNQAGTASWNEYGCIDNPTAARPEGCGPLGPQLCKEPPQPIRIDVTIKKADWDWIHKNTTSEKAFPVDVTIGSSVFPGSTMEIHGGFARTVPKLSFRFELPDNPPGNLDLFGDGVEKQRRFVLKAGWIDGTWAREYLTMNLIRMSGGLAPRVAYAQLYVNGEWHGLYLVVERIDKVWAKKNGLEDDEFNLYKAENHYANWRDKENPTDGYELQYGEPEHADDIGFLLDACSNTPTTDADFAADVEPWLNIHDFLVFQMVRTFAEDQDTFTKNYYLYHDLEAEKGERGFPFRIINWDADATFGNNWDGAVIAADKSNWYGTDGFAPRLLKVPGWRSKYLSQYREALENLLNPTVIESRLNRVVGVIREPAIKDLEKWNRGMNFDDEVARLRAAIATRSRTMNAVLSSLN